MSGWSQALRAVVLRELWRFWQQRGRFVSALVRPLVWLFVFAAGFRAVLGLSMQPPYQTYVLYDVYIVPGLCAMIALFNGMQSSLSMVYDREMGSMRVLLVSPFPRAFLLVARLLAATVVSVLQIAAFLVIAALFGIDFAPAGYALLLPMAALAAFMLGAFGLALSSLVKQIENFAGVMNFVIFPTFFASSALYPLWRVREGSYELWLIARANPFTHATELLRFALYGQIEPTALAVVVGCAALFTGLAVWGYDPGRGAMARRTGPA